MIDSTPDNAVSHPIVNPSPITAVKEFYTEKEYYSPAIPIMRNAATELLSVVTFVRKFKQYLLGRLFTIQTDHAVLQWLKHTPESIGEQA